MCPQYVDTCTWTVPGDAIPGSATEPQAGRRVGGSSSGECGAGPGAGAGPGPGAGGGGRTQHPAPKRRLCIANRAVNRWVSPDTRATQKSWTPKTSTFVVLSIIPPTFSANAPLHDRSIPSSHTTLLALTSTLLHQADRDSLKSSSLRASKPALLDPSSSLSAHIVYWGNWQPSSRSSLLNPEVIPITECPRDPLSLCTGDG